MAIEIVEVSRLKMVMFHRFLDVYQRVSLSQWNQISWVEVVRLMGQVFCLFAGDVSELTIPHGKLQEIYIYIWLVVWNIFSIDWEEYSQLTNIFQRDWNHQPYI